MKTSQPGTDHPSYKNASPMPYPATSERGLNCAILWQLPTTIITSPNSITQTMLRGTAWEDTCSGWYHDNTGRITAVWPGSGLHFQQVIRNPRWEDYNIKYMNKHNMFAYFGLGFTQAERDPNADKAPYMDVKFLDKDFYDYGKVPDYQGPAPTKERSRLATAES
jgi:hypothetical protein